MTQILGLIFEGVLGAVISGIKGLWYSWQLSSETNRANEAEADYFSEKTKTKLLIKKAESKMKLRKNLDKIAHPSRNLQEYIERDKEL